jgi:hypothetical protein
MIVGAPFLAAPWVVPAGTAAAALLHPLAQRVAAERTGRALVWLVAIGASIGFALLFLFGLAITLINHADYPRNPALTAVMIAQVYGPLFGGLTAFGWWSQSPRSAIRNDKTAKA